jgi:hypothetical protein
LKNELPLGYLCSLRVHPPTTRPTSNDWLDSIEEEKLLSMITVGEIQRGIERCQFTSQDRIMVWMNNGLLQRFASEWLSSMRHVCFMGLTYSAPKLLASQWA